MTNKRSLTFHVFYSDQTISGSCYQPVSPDSEHVFLNSYKLSYRPQPKFSYCYSPQWEKSAETREDCEEFQKGLKILSRGNSTLGDKCGAMHIWQNNLNYLYKLTCSNQLQHFGDTSVIDKSTKFLPRCEAACKTEMKTTLWRTEGKPQMITKVCGWLTGIPSLRNTVSSYHAVSRKKEMWKNKDRIRFCLLPECMSTRHIHGALYRTTPGLGVWELVYLCDGAAPCSHSKSGSGKAKASLAPSQLAWRRLHGYGRKPNGRWDLMSAGIKPATI